MACAGEEGLLSVGFKVYLFFHRFNSISNSSGDGRSSLYILTADCKLTSLEQSMFGTRPSNRLALMED